MERQKTKLGARVLSESELEAVLPNVGSVYRQIEVFRSSIPDENDEQGDTEQKTNNIGIMGRRGAGKTSILRTFHEKLKEKNTDKQKEKKDDKGGDIILPIIIPENMSSGTTLMDVILGILKPVVEERESKKAREKQWGEDCIYSGRSPLEKAYNDLVKQYCYIKKDYRDILIQQFTTEQNYVDKTKEVFNSDTEFIKMFNRFVKLLLKREENDDTQCMMFLFIDDIDLSTTRCMDVVRTLLSYLSNPRIVTFISGDMETFEEALTLDFLRQEKALSADVFQKTYYSTTENAEGKLLERKKTLAYEYLKKIIPPAYRKSIKYWSLEERGRYRIGGDEKKNLADLLAEMTKGKLEDAYFIYKEDGEQKHMSLVFHMFDDTSRGLNNVYNVLQELDSLKSKEEDRATGFGDELLFWRLIETMVDSKPLYAKLKRPLFEQIIVLEQNQVKVDFDNAFQLLYGESGGKGFTPKEQFAVFLLVDFAAGLFSQNQEDDFAELKYRIIQEYLSDEKIDDKIASERELLVWHEEEGDNKKNNEKKANKTAIQSILINFLEHGEFIFILYLIKYLGRAEIYNIFGNGTKNQQSERETAYKIAYALARAVWAMRDTDEGRKKYLADLYVRMQSAMLELLGMLSLNPLVIYGARLIGKITVEFGGLTNIGSSTNLAVAGIANVNYFFNESSRIKQFLLWAEHQNETNRYWIYFERNLREKTEDVIPFNVNLMAENLIRAGLTKTVMNQMQETMDKYAVKELQSVNYDYFPEKSTGIGVESQGEQNNLKKEKRERQAIVQIDENGLWKTVYSKEKIYPYLKKIKNRYIFEMTRGRVIFDATELLSGAYYELVKCEKGSSGTALVYGLVNLLKRILTLSESSLTEESSLKMFSDGKYYMRLEQVLVIQCLLEQFLDKHPRVRYGKMESRRLIMEMKELPLVIRTSEWDNIHEELKKREDLFFSRDEANLKDDAEKKLGDGLNDIVEQIYMKYLESVIWPQHPPLVETIRVFLRERLTNTVINNNNDFFFIQYLVRQKAIKKKLEEYGLSQENWKEIEPVIPKASYMFIFHSYLRYLQVNDPDAEKAGAQAEKIAILAKYLLESEVIADKQIQSEVYEVISRNLALTEEEFEALF